MITLGIISMVLMVAQLAMMAIAYAMYKPPRMAKQPPTFSEFRLAATKIGSPIPATFGLVKLGGNIIEWGDWQVIKHTKVEQPAGGGKGK